MLVQKRNVIFVAFLWKDHSFQSSFLPPSSTVISKIRLLFCEMWYIDYEGRCFVLISWKTKHTKIVYSECLLRLVVLRVLCCSVCVFCKGFFVMVPLNLACLHCLQHFFFKYISSIYIHISAEFSQTTIQVPS